MTRNAESHGPVTVLLLRHGRSTANASGVLAGRMPGVHLDEVGQDQAARLVKILGQTKIEFIVHSDLVRTRETVSPLAQYLEIPLIEDVRVTECDYGQWSGRALSDLSQEPLWKTVQSTPSTVTFPSGESMKSMQERAVGCVRERAQSADKLFAVCSHGDVIKAVIADALGLELDNFQSIDIQPASISMVQYFADGKARVLLLNYPVSENAFESLSLEAKETLGGGDVRA